MDVGVGAPPHAASREREATWPLPPRRRCDRGKIAVRGMPVTYGLTGIVVHARPSAAPQDAEA
jgi:hypothetical protein